MNKELKEIVNQAKDMLDSLEIDYQKDVSIGFNNRLKTTLGRCIQTPYRNTYRIEINKKIFL